MNYLLRRRGLGLGSCRGIRDNSQTGIDFIRNDKILPANADYVFRWGCTSNVPNGEIVNKAAAIHKVANKAQFRMECANSQLAPRSWLSVEDFENADEEDVWPVIVRRSRHHQGRFLHTCSNLQEVRAACAKYGEGNYYISEFIDKVAEYRVFLVSGRVVWVAQKTPGNPDDVAWNVNQGGRFDNVRWSDWPLKSVKVARKAFLLSGLDFGGVDVMVDRHNNVYVLEINSAPSQTSPYRQSCTAKAFDYIVNNGREFIPIIEELGGWRKFIHPCLTEEAQLA